MSAALAYVLVFATSAAILVLEILAGRLLAPYVGVTLETFTGIIGTILAGISVGAWAGGRLADQRDPRSLLGPILVLGGLFSFLAPVMVDVFGSGVRQGGPLAIVTLSAVGFFLPAAVLSAVTPTVVKLRLDDLGETGRVVGRLSAISTAGAIAGTFLAGFVLISAAPTRPLIRGIAIALVASGIALWVRLRRDATTSVLPGLLIGVLLAGGVSLLFPGPCDYESAYFCARVEEDPDRRFGRTLRLDTLRHSYVDLADPTYLEFTYAQTISDVLDAYHPRGAAVDALHVGGGGFTFPRYIRTLWPGSTSTVLELDPLLVRIAQEELGLDPGDDIAIRTGDARLTLQDEPAAAYDVVVGDAFGGISVPWHLTTVEFVRSIEDRLRPDGYYVLNLIDHPPLGFARAEAATLSAVFDHVAVLAPPQRLAGRSGGNFILVGSDRPIPVEAILARNADRGDDEDAVWTGSGLAEFLSGADVLRDDFAPVDQLITPRPRRG